jgi:hypothetical protein
MNETVRIVQLLSEGREVAGTYGYVQDPQVGDTGQVIFEYPGPLSPVTVQKSDAEGHIVWFADFARDELEFLPPAG